MSTEFIREYQSMTKDDFSIKDVKTRVVLDLVVCLQKTTVGKTTDMISLKYKISKRTAKRYLKVIDDSAFNLVRDYHEQSRRYLYKII